MKKLVLSVLTTTVVSSIGAIEAQVPTLVELVAKKYSMNLPMILQDLENNKLNLEVQESIKKELINKYPHLFPVPYIIVLKDHTKKIISVALSKSGQYALTGSEDNTARLWDLKTGKTIQTLEGHAGTVTSVAFISDGKHALTGSSDRTVRLWDLEIGQTIKIFHGPTESTHVWSVAFGKNEKYALTRSSDDKTACLWNIETGQIVYKLQGNTADITSSVFSFNG